MFTYLIFFFGCLACQAQDSVYMRKAFNELTSPKMWGRGYTKNGMQTAANFIAKEFKSLGLKPMDGKQFDQHFSYPVNTFPSEMEITINGRELIPGKDFLVNQSSKGVKINNAKVVRADSSNFIAPTDRILLTLQDKLTWSVAKEVDDFTQILIRKSAIDTPIKNLSVDIKNNFIPNFTIANICGMVKGTKNPDSVLLITAHYDHLGGMGAQTFFPGANDNASGVSFLLSLAKYYAQNPQPYSIGFICFAGEEAGLIGSKFFTENPLVPLHKIRFLFNVDMVGTGIDGATVVNATLHESEFAQLQNINSNKHYLPKINARGKAANSDHYFFTEKGVPAFFLYTQGGIQAYHNVDDQPTTLPFTVYSGLFKLLVAFNKSLMD